MSDAVTPFTVDVDQEHLDDLRDRLARTRYPDQLPQVGWSYGAPAEYVKELTQYWERVYDWRGAETKLNAYPQFTTVIDGTRIHFYHVRSSVPDATPLLLVHGWPSGPHDFLNLIGPLTDPARYGGDPADAFDVVIPTLPGFGFSGPTTETGWGCARITLAFEELMSRLGYQKYGTHGGDFGERIARGVGVNSPAKVIGVHLTSFFAAVPTEQDIDKFTDEDRTILEQKQSIDWSLGYTAQMCSRPQTLSYGLIDSPAGQLAWILEKFWEWTDHSEASLEDAVSRDAILTTAAVYWLTGTANSSSRLYYEEHHALDVVVDGNPLLDDYNPAPTGILALPAEMSIPIRTLQDRVNNVVHWTVETKGGHFPSLEVPDLVVDDLRAFFRELRR
jgi:epoxide hydrolase